MRERAKELAAAHPGLSDILSKLADGITTEGMEAFAPVLAERMELLLDYVPAGGCVLACDPERIRARAADLVATSQEFLAASWVSAAVGGQAPIDLGAAAFRPIGEIRGAAADLDLPWWTSTPFVSKTRPRIAGGTPGRRGGRARPGRRASRTGRRGWLSEPADGRSSFRLDAKPAEAYRGDTSRVIADVRQWLAGDWRVVLVTEGHGPAQRLAELLHGAGRGDPGRGSRTRRRSRGSRTWRPGSSPAGSAGRRRGWRCCPRPTWSGSGPAAGPARCGCRAGGAAASTRCG